MPNKRNIKQLEELTGLFKESEYFSNQKPVNTGNNMILGIPESCWIEKPEINDELGTSISCTLRKDLRDETIQGPGWQTTWKGLI